ncbi:hypothetical protein GEM17_18290 [Salmonella enterica]|nr:hypothetical protein [Salmonella enterica]
MALTVTSAQYLHPGRLHVYNMSNGSVAEELPHLPPRIGLKCYDAAGRRICKPAVINEMKSAIKRHKQKWKLAK